MSSGYLALYCRLSKAPNGQVESVERQERWGREYASERLPELAIRVYRDNDVSAFSDAAERPDYDRLRRDITAGHIAAVWCVEQTRLEANKRRWVELVAELDDAGIGVIHTNRDGLVRLDEVADIKNIMAWHERKRLRERVNDTLQDLAKEGRPGPGSSFGYRHQRDESGRSWLVQVEGEAEMVRWAAERMLSGWTLTAVAREFNRRNVPTRRGGREWNTERIRSVLCSPTTAGKRVYRGEVACDGEWDAILDEVTWRRLCAMFDRSRRRQRKPRRYLLSGGLAGCGLCGCNLSGARVRGPRETYTCPTSRGGCARVSIGAVGLEEYVAAMLNDRLRSEEFRAQIAAGDPYRERREALTGALAGLDTRRRSVAARYAKGDLEEDEWDAIRDGLKAERERLTAELVAVPAPIVGIDPDAVTRGWDKMTRDERRYVLGLFFGRVVVAPGKGGQGFDPGRVTVYDTAGEVVPPIVWLGPPWSDEDLIAAVAASGARSKTEYTRWRAAQDRPWPSVSSIEHRLVWSKAVAAAHNDVSPLEKPHA